MAKNGKKNKSLTLTEKGITYRGTVKDNKIRVTTTRTAQGQHMTVGVFDIATRQWHNDELPKNVKLKIEAAY
ncbi:hypothetical protein J6X04_03320 [Candidatus Saccharibacteria bacterium]|nr:hypothetical protein [Candidatus Saccharibacteria bacterium]